ncbi:MAG: hypothetical protein GC201_01775 [Alphaproteobacteria bacterium]|nr:hypothetical protein [Alphaproteobacteria bacterium]
MRRITTLGIALGIAVGLAQTGAQATSRFTIDNQSQSKLNIRVFRGADAWCTVKEKEKTVKPFTKESIGCTGNGQGRCQIIVRDVTNQQRLCGAGNGNDVDLYFGSCNGKTITMPNNSTLVINQMSAKERPCDLQEAK